MTRTLTVVLVALLAVAAAITFVAYEVALGIVTLFAIFVQGATIS